MRREESDASGFFLSRMTQRFQSIYFQLKVTVSTSSLREGGEAVSTCRLTHKSLHKWCICNVSQMMNTMSRHNVDVKSWGWGLSDDDERPPNKKISWNEMGNELNTDSVVCIRYSYTMQSLNISSMRTYRNKLVRLLVSRSLRWSAEIAHVAMWPFNIVSLVMEANTQNHNAAWLLIWMLTCTCWSSAYQAICQTKKNEINSNSSYESTKRNNANSVKPECIEVKENDLPM